MGNPCFWIRFCVALQCLLLAGVACAQDPGVLQLQYSADIGANIVGVSQFAARKDYVIDDLMGTRLRVSVPGLTDRINLNDFQIDAGNVLLFATDVGLSLGGSYYRAGDVIAYSNGVYSRVFDASAAGVPRGVVCDGVARSGAAGALLLSFDRSFTVGGTLVRPADVIAQSGAGLGAKVLDARALGLPAQLNVDAIDSVATTSDLLVSFDSGGSVGGVVFADEDILQLHLASNAWSKRYTMLSRSDRWGAANLDGLAAVPQGDAVFANGFE